MFNKYLLLVTVTHLYVSCCKMFLRSMMTMIPSRQFQQELKPGIMTVQL